jgi:hypothetical protein
LKAIGNSIQFINVAMTQMSELFSIPVGYTYLVFLILLVVVGFAIIGAIMKV